MNRTLLRLAIIAALLPATTLAAPAQQLDRRDEAALRARTRAFLRAVENDSLEAVRGYFPRRGDWTWISTEHGAGIPRREGRWRFTGAETLRALRNGAPVCESFRQAGGEYGPLAGTLADALREHGTAWRHVRGTRFAPRASARRPYTYVEWRREDGRWVIATLADEAFLYPDSPSTPLDRPLIPAARREVSLLRPGVFAPTEGYAGGEAWYEQHLPIEFDGLRYFEYGLPRPLADHELARVGSLGPIGLYREAGTTGTPSHLYVPVRPGEYVPFQTFGPFRCHQE
ncbi:MAG TPA: hypothetical protein VF705_01335 [Longimicrobium sp.]|jgi:hypothetical protein